MPETPASYYTPDELLYAACDVITEAYTEAMALHGTYTAIRERKLAPVYNLQRPASNFHLEHMKHLSERMDEAVQRAGGLIIAHEEPVYDSLGQVQDIEERNTPIRNCFFEPEQGVLYGLFLGSSHVLDFAPRNIVVPNGNYQARQIIEEPEIDEQALMVEARLQHMLDSLAKEQRQARARKRLATTNLRLV